MPGDFEGRVLPLEKDLYFAARALTGQDADALDLVQETLLKAWRGFSLYRRDENLKAWLFTILRNAYVDRCRRRRIDPVPLSDEAAPAADGQPVRLEDALPDDLLGALRRLCPAHQLVLLLRDVEGLSYREISGVLGCPIGSVMSGLHNARSKLRDALTYPPLSERGQGGTPP